MLDCEGFVYCWPCGSLSSGDRKFDLAPDIVTLQDTMQCHVCKDAPVECYVALNNKFRYRKQYNQPTQLVYDGYQHSSSTTDLETAFLFGQWGTVKKCFLTWLSHSILRSKGKLYMNDLSFL